MPFIRLSSSVTLFYKLIVPFGGLLVLGVYASVIAAHQWPWELHGVLLGALGALLLLFTGTTALPIRHVAYNAEFIRIRNYGAAQLFPVQEYRRLEPAYFVMMRLHLLDRSFLFLGSLPGLFARLVNNSGSVLNGSLEPPSINVARRTLRAAAQQARQ
ncbi:hypothetical protein [Hymenobacter terrestris]|uniref:PH domain-containing protein n=1 Tax=Hymenobacter terrestris TaxID=2748310 RepID=A0ABX2Q9J0_9BACT|nr:hypothetical protein [Hymenobacter terrestris]NVO86412.1 hypothetical protein [Hymenobacter terrestris]